MLKIAKLLLENGASANSYFVTEEHEEGSDDKMPALYGPCSVTNFPELAEVLLKAGANPNDRESLCHAIIRGRDGRTVELLLRHGATANAVDKKGRTPIQLAYRYGNVSALEVLREHVSKPKMATGEEFIAACARADRTSAKQILVEKQGLVKSLSAENAMLLPEFASLGKIEAVRLMLDLGFDINMKGAWGGTAVHQAA